VSIHALPVGKKPEGRYAPGGPLRLGHKTRHILSNSWPLGGLNAHTATQSHGLPSLLPSACNLTGGTEALPWTFDAKGLLAAIAGFGDCFRLTLGVSTRRGQDVPAGELTIHGPQLKFGVTRPWPLRQPAGPSSTSETQRLLPSLRFGPTTRETASDRVTLLLGERHKVDDVRMRDCQRFR
jgi:hypothetical protein